MTEKVFGKIDEKGKFKPYNEDSLINAFYQLRGKRVELSIRSETKQRTNQQNRWYWTEVVPKVFEFFTSKTEENLTKEDVHEWLKKNFAGSKEIKIGKEEFSRPKSTTELSTVEFNEMVNKIQQFFAQYGVVIHDPDQTQFLEE